MALDLSGIIMEDIFAPGNFTVEELFKNLQGACAFSCFQV
jgi:hypothetical protein